MKVSRFIAIFILIWGCSKQTNSDQPKINFEIAKSTINKAQLDSIKNELLLQKDSILFEDSVYSVRSTCRGEWGGSIWFTNKRTGIEYSCAATCPVTVNSIEGLYMVTTTLAHGPGSSRIIQILNPDLMEVFELPEPKEVSEDGTPVYYVTDFESHSYEGTTSLLDTVGILTLSSFKYEGELYHITTDFKSTFVSNIQKGKFAIIDTIANKSIWTYKPEVLILENGHLITFFTNDETKGYIDIWENKIDLKLLK